MFTSYIHGREDVMKLVNRSKWIFFSKKEEAIGFCNVNLLRFRVLEIKVQVLVHLIKFTDVHQRYNMRAYRNLFKNIIRYSQHKKEKKDLLEEKYIMFDSLFPTL